VKDVKTAANKKRKNVFYIFMSRMVEIGLRMTARGKSQIPLR